MKESLAAGLLLGAGWDKLVNAARTDGLGAVLIDPMTGSGTLPVEAALIACDVAPGLSRISAWRDNGRGSSNPHRRPPCTRWKDFGDAATWDELLATATRRAEAGTTWARSAAESGENNVTILCREQNPGAARLARTCVRNADVTALVAVSEGDCRDWDLGGEEPVEERAVVEGRTMFVCNPVSTMDFDCAFRVRNRD
jgi:23S rRNA (guanine2445-N2)-methyltransferase / 23S rRNA (guanine2069-N7)-methyltransferase